MLHPHTEVRFINEEIGRGVFATRPIPKGTVVWVQDRFDRVFTESEVRSLEPVYQEILETYCFRDRLGRWVFCWDNTRFVNHSFRPTCILTPYGFELAVTDIAAGQQVTNDYGFFNIIEPFDCLPEPGCDRGRVLPDDLMRYADRWDTQLTEAFRFFDKVSQPLSKLLSEENLQKALRIAKGEETADSIRICYFSGDRGGCAHA